MKKVPVNNECDYLIAEAQRVTNEAKRLLEEARQAGDYYREKLAAKLVAFCEAEENYLGHYAELKTYYPDLARAVEERRGHLLALLAQAKTKYDQLKS